MSSTHLIIFLAVTAGLTLAAGCTSAAYTPSPKQWTVSVGGQPYNSSTAYSEKTVISNAYGTQYDCLVGTGGTGGEVQP